MPKIKICGLRTLEDIAVINEVQPDYVGFVFAESKRKISKNTARVLKEGLSQKILSVGVFVQEPIQNIVSLCNQGIIDLVQHHGEESFDYITELRSRINQPIIYARRLRTREEAYLYDEYPVDYLLFDTYVQGVYGGSGRLINYRQIPKMNKPIILAGGLNAENVEEVLSTIHPYCVDVSSGVETDGNKDGVKILEFIQKVRNLK